LQVPLSLSFISREIFIYSPRAFILTEYMNVG
jgi:hypothetical protein